MPRTEEPRSPTCLARTCLKWTADGELSEEDKRLVLNRLMRVDGAFADPSRSPSL
ncbi:MAG: hypothetical protein VKP63_02460 [Cyanobacteriota bacterium]|nr:hypothetical protein [Cyanobacteriota bacterium]